MPNSGSMVYSSSNEEDGHSPRSQRSNARSEVFRGHYVGICPILLLLDNAVLALTELYKNDDHTKEQKMTPEERLFYHQKDSKPLMDQLNSFMSQQMGSD